MIERLPNSHCYRVTDAGFRAALFFTRAYSLQSSPPPRSRRSPARPPRYSNRPQTILRQNRYPPHCMDQTARINSVKLDTFSSYVFAQAKLVQVGSNRSFIRGMRDEECRRLSPRSENRTGPDGGTRPAGPVFWIRPAGGVQFSRLVPGL
jgi:hypothetical protein